MIFFYHVMNMLGAVIASIPRNVTKLIKLSRCYDEDRKIGHDWGSFFLLENCTMIRVFGCPLPPYFLPRFTPERLGIVEFF